MSKMTAMVQGKPSDSETMVYRDKGYKCGIDVTLAVVGGKWKASILWHLARATMRLSELQRQFSDTTRKMLIQQN